MGQIVATTSEPMVGAMRLQWWKEALERLDEAPPPAEPRLKAAADHLLPLGISGRDLGHLEDGWRVMLEEKIDPERIANRGRYLFALGARLLGQHEIRGGGVFALAQAARIDPSLTRAARKALALVRTRIAPKSRPMTMLSILAIRDLLQPGEPPATPGRAWALLKHRWNGRWPRLEGKGASG